MREGENSAAVHIYRREMSQKQDSDILFCCIRAFNTIDVIHILVSQRQAVIREIKLEACTISSAFHKDLTKEN
jgi:hypothetical protein